MKRVFKFKKGQKTDWDEELLMFLEEYLTDGGIREHNFFPMFTKNWKVTLIIDDLDKKIRRLKN